MLKRLSSFFVTNNTNTSISEKHINNHHNHHNDHNDRILRAQSENSVINIKSHIIDTKHKHNNDDDNISIASYDGNDYVIHSSEYKKYGIYEIEYNNNGPIGFHVDDVQSLLHDGRSVHAITIKTIDIPSLTLSGREEIAKIAKVGDIVAMINNSFLLNSSLNEFTSNVKSSEGLKLSIIRPSKISLDSYILRKLGQTKPESPPKLKTIPAFKPDQDLPAEVQKHDALEQLKIKEVTELQKMLNNLELERREREKIELAEKRRLEGMQKQLDERQQELLRIQLTKRAAEEKIELERQAKYEQEKLNEMKLLVEERGKELNEIKEKNDMFEKLAKENEIKMKKQEEEREKKLLQDRLEEKTRVELERRERERLSKLEEEHLRTLAQMVEEKQSSLTRVQSEFELAEKMKQKVEESIREAEKEGRKKIIKEEEERIVSSLQAAIESEDESLIQYALQEALLTRIESTEVEVAKKMIKKFEEARRIAEEKAEKKSRALAKAKARDDIEERLKFFGGPAHETDYGSPESSPKNKKGKKAKGGYPEIPNRVSTPTLSITPLKRPNDDNSSVRAYPKDSRAAWVEMQHVRGPNFVVGRENLPLGPGEYIGLNASSNITRHISTPSLGHGAVGNFYPLDHPSVVRPGESLAQSSLTSHYGKEEKEQYNIVDDINLQKEKTEFRTVFHDYDRRQPLDPNRKFTKTPGPGSYLQQDTITDTVTIYGKYKAPGFTFNSDNLPDYKYSRNNVQPSLPIYDVNYDSKHCKPGILLAKISQSERFPSTEKAQRERSPSPDSKRFNDKQPASLVNSSIITSDSIQSQIRMPKLKSIDKLVMKFDARSYTNNKIKPEIVLCPSLIEKKIRKNAFMAMITVKTEHKTSHIETKVNNRLKMNL